MKKKEIRWISKDDCPGSLAEIWGIKPVLRFGEYVNTKTGDSTGRMGRVCSLRPYIGMDIKQGGLAKVTIERQY